LRYARQNALSSYDRACDLCSFHPTQNAGNRSSYVRLLLLAGADEKYKYLTSGSHDVEEEHRPQSRATVKLEDPLSPRTIALATGNPRDLLVFDPLPVPDSEVAATDRYFQNEARRLKVGGYSR
jgi:hypothetical protein